MMRALMRLFRLVFGLPGAVQGTAVALSTELAAARADVAEAAARMQATADENTRANLTNAEETRRMMRRAMDGVEGRDRRR